MMNEMVSVGGKLALICAVAAITLGLVSAVTAPAIVKVKEKQLAAALDTVRGNLSAGEEMQVDGNSIVRGYYPLTGSQGPAGYILKIVGVGYGGDMELLASMASTGEIRSITLMDNLETPGLGKEAEKSAYMEKFIGTGADRLVPMTKLQLSQNQADSISGASITFMGIAQALEAAAEYVKNELDN